MPDAASASSPDVESDGLVVDGALKDGVTWHARDAAGTHLVLKRLPDDCLRHGALHPAVRVRLARLREVPMAAFANVVGVRSIDEGVVLVSEFIVGRPLAGLNADERGPHHAEARRLVESLHHAGLVHGAVRPGNFVIDDAGRLRLIDPSPLLYDDPATDLAALAKWFPIDAATADDAGERPATRPAWRPLVAAAALVVSATAAAVGWALHVAGRP